jgi:hypothetical protein
MERKEWKLPYYFIKKIRLGSLDNLWEKGDREQKL